MHWLNLPAAEPTRHAAFADLASAKAWLAAQPQTQPLLMLELLTGQLNATDGARQPPGLIAEQLDLLHSASVTTLSALESRYTRKPLPIPADDESIFVASQHLWTRLGIAYLRLAPHFAPKDKCRLLFRAANAFRTAEFCHFLAARECPAQLDQLLFGVLIQAESSGILRQPVTDKDFPHLGEGNIAGLLAWAFLLRLIDPYRLTAPQLAVANRAISRWRELCSFHMEADQSANAREISLTSLFGTTLPEGMPRLLGIRSIARKISARVEALQNGETPESLKLGRELSGSACIRLLTDIDRYLLASPPAPAGESGDVQLAFGPADAYALFTEELLNPEASMDVSSEALANERMAIFGFDQVARMPTAVQRLHIPGEMWKVFDGIAIRPPETGERRLAPCLIATLRDGQARLGVLRALLGDAGGSLSGTLDWYAGKIEACRLKPLGPREQKMPRVAAFLLHDAGQVSLLIPSAAPIRPGIGLALEGGTLEHLVPIEVIERGIDFVRYSCRLA